MLALIVLAVLAAVVWTIMTIGSLFAPRVVVMATGPEGSAQYEFSPRYQEILARAGVELRLVPTAGGVENLELLSDPRSGVGVAFVEGGLTTREKSPDLVSLGTVGLEPLWIFMRAESQGRGPQKLAGKRISIEPEGSATRVIGRRFLELNGLSETGVTLLGLTPEQSAEALLRREIDCSMMLASWRSPSVQKLLVADGVVLESHPRADAYVARFPSITKVILPTGVADLARNIPSTDVTLIAVEADLVARRNLHPALQYLLLEAASEIHGGGTFFNRAGRFPAPESSDLPLSEMARTYFKSGRPFTYRVLPYWLAGLVERLLILLIPLFTIVFPIVRLFPAVHASIIQRRLFGMYGELKLLEAEMQATAPGADLHDYKVALEDLNKRANRMKVPLGYVQRLYILKSHIASAQAESEKRR